MIQAKQTHVFVTLDMFKEHGFCQAKQKHGYTLQATNTCSWVFKQNKNLTHLHLKIKEHGSSKTKSWLHLKNKEHGSSKTNTLLHLKNKEHGLDPCSLQKHVLHLKNKEHDSSKTKTRHT